MVLSIIGLGLYDLTDITLRGLEAIRQAEVIYLERYTSILHSSKEKLEDFFGKKIIVATRELVELEGDDVVDQARDMNVAFLVVGDPFGATTHIDLVLRAKKAGVDVEVIHNASILTAVGVVGLELYKYGKTTSIVFPDDNWLPRTPYETIQNNLSLNLHTLCLLDIKVAEPLKKDLLKGIYTPQPPRLMSIDQAIKVLERLEEQQNDKVITEETLLVGVARLGKPGSNPIIKAGTKKELKSYNFGEPMHSLIVPSKKLHHMEEEMIKQWK